MDGPATGIHCSPGTLLHSKATVSRERQKCPSRATKPDWQIGTVTISGTPGEPSRNRTTSSPWTLSGKTTGRGVPYSYNGRHQGTIATDSIQSLTILAPRTVSVSIITDFMAEGTLRELALCLSLLKKV